jgi:hypothetical protein
LQVFSLGQSAGASASPGSHWVVTTNP